MQCILFVKGLPPVIIRLFLECCGTVCKTVYLNAFGVENGIQQGVVVSRVLFYVYDELLLK